MKDGVSEMGTRLDPVPGLPGGESADIVFLCICVHSDRHTDVMSSTL